MPADLTATDIIALLREHPGACELIELRITKDGSRAYSAEFADLWRDDPPQCIPGFRRWLTGAAVEKHIELDIAFRNAYGLDEATPAADACELVARLAEIMVGLIEESDKDGVPVNDWTVPLRALIADARRGGGA